jgi:hypothetical protein
VRAAIDEKVDALVLAGDVVDQVNDRFEAYGVLERGVARLLGEGIAVFGVAGNHDVKVLPRLADQIPEFRLIGRGGEWETIEIGARVGGQVRLLGWSFPREKVQRSPLGDLRFEAAGDTPTLGVLHCDLGAASGPYAPVSRAELESVAVAGWFLGHVHKPSAELQWPRGGDREITPSGERPIGYLGSLTAMDPGEQGPHGPWLVEVTRNGIERSRQLPISPLRFETERVPLDGIEESNEDDLEAALTTQIRLALERVAERLGDDALADCRVVSCRLVLSGRTAAHRGVRALLASGQLGILEKSAASGRGRVAIERIDDEALPALDLEALSRTNDPLGLLAQDLLAIAGGSRDSAKLLHDARSELERVFAGGDFAVLDRPTLSPADVRARVERVARELLEDVLAQRSTQGGAP